MPTTDAPETDEAAQWYEGIGWAVPAHLATKLERERNQLAAAMEEMPPMIVLPNVKESGKTCGEPLFYDDDDWVCGSTHRAGSLQYCDQCDPENGIKYKSGEEAMGLDANASVEARQ